MLQVPVPSSTVFAVFLHGPRSVMELDVARSERHDSALSRARLGKPGEVFSHEASKNDTMIFQSVSKRQERYC